MALGGDAPVGIVLGDATFPQAATLDRRVARDQPDLVAQHGEPTLDKLDGFHDDRRRTRCFSGLHPGQDSRPDGGMDDRLEIAQRGRIVEHDASQRPSVDRAVGPLNVWPEAADDGLADRRVLVDLADQAVGVNDDRPVLGKHP
jgi:hypothetical protein